MSSAFYLSLLHIVPLLGVLCLLSDSVFSIIVSLYHLIFLALFSPIFCFQFLANIFYSNCPCVFWSSTCPAFLKMSSFFFFSPFSFLFWFSSHACPCMSCISVPVVCSVHPPASHSAPSFLRQYAGHLGRTALRREPGGGLERERALLSLHRTGSLGIRTHMNTHVKLCRAEKYFSSSGLFSFQK